MLYVYSTTYVSGAAPDPLPSLLACMLLIMWEVGERCRLVLPLV
jgi:hypothetical protein